MNIIYNMKKGVIILVLVIVVVILAGFLFMGSKSKQQPEQGGADQTTQKNYINLRGMEGIIEGKISPSEGNKVKGIIEVSITKVPGKTEIVYFAMLSSGRELSNRDLRADTDGSDGWSMLIDTTTEVNGLYDIIVLAEYPGRPDEEGPLDALQSQIIVEN